MKNGKCYTGGENNNARTSALSKIVHLTLITSFSKQLIKGMKRIQKSFMWNNLTLKIKHETLCNSFEEGSLKDIDMIGLQV